MSSNRDPIEQFEGRWDEVVLHSDQFAGRFVRVTVLPDKAAAPPSLQAEIRRWLTEGNAMEVAPSTNSKTDIFGDVLVEKYRKQGLVL